MHKDAKPFMVQISIFIFLIISVCVLQLRSSYIQTATDCDDIPIFENQLHLAFVTSTKAYAKILKVDPSEALTVKGVVTFLSAKDLKESQNRNKTGDEKIFYDQEVTSVGQPIGAVIAIDRDTAQKAARKVKIDYQELQPVVITIEDAIKHNSFFKNPHQDITKGDFEQVLKKAPHVLEGECRMGGQEHFYFETQSVVVVPKLEDSEFEIYSSTQNPSEVAASVATVLEVPQHKIVTKVKRVGGAFGGKQSKSVVFAIPAAIAAAKLNRPVRCVLDRHEDIAMTGGRHPVLIKYRVAFDAHGKILGIDVKIYGNCGYSLDASAAVIAKAMINIENSYAFPVIRVNGYLCKTNLPSNTAFRGFGVPQGMYGAECILEDVAKFLKKDITEVRYLNLYREGDVTHYDQKLTVCTLEQCWKECIESSNYHQSSVEVEKFNNDNKYKKRGLCMMPTKYGIGFTQEFLNQAGALVLVYTDGSVLISHGGVEMGQGLHTKMIQVAATCLKIPFEKIHIVETATDKVPNTSVTAASAGSDINGMAVLNACNLINERLQPYKDQNPGGKWEDWVSKAYFDRVSLSAAGFHKTLDVGHNWKTGDGNLYDYFTYGVACCEVEIDTLTGDHQVLRVDIVMDLGESLNPAIDIGQIEGAFLQGYGLFVLEELVYSPSGINYTTGPGTYKIPGFADIPGEFNVSLLKGVSNSRAVYSSKATGEPPLFLGSSVFFAIKDAIKAARRENGTSPEFKLDSPATADRIRLACRDNIMSQFQEPEPGTCSPWRLENV